MLDKFGNELKVGDRVIYADSGRRGILHRGTIKDVWYKASGHLTIDSEHNTQVSRRANQVVLYK